ncbi:MAG: tRNA preQ1(34) S-adenosylmethionine ribosyltransferase-isomerase QueA [Candidatus Acidiferrales bacterium]
MRLSDFSFELPEGRIAERPLDERDASGLMLLDRERSKWEDREFCELAEILRGDELMVVNNTRVIPARLFGVRMGVGSQTPGKNNPARSEYLTGKIEVLLTRKLEEDTWEALVRPGRKVRLGERINFGDGELEAEIIWRGELGLRKLRFTARGDLQGAIEKLGHVPLPPYIRREDEPEDRARYQTVFAREGSAVAAPTAGLHFTSGMLERLRKKGIEICELTLDVGLGTFQPIHEEEVEKHQIHSEAYDIPDETARRIRLAKNERRPVLAVGTTVVRALEDAARKAAGAGDKDELPRAGRGEAVIYIYPGHKFRVVDQMLTNFHLPRSSLFVMASAFAGREFLLSAYRHAIAAAYRFYSYGDCMLIR